MGDHDFLGPDRPRHDGVDLTKATDLKLPDDAHASADSLSEYPMHVSVMEISGTPTWNGSSDTGVVLTVRGTTFGWQHVVWQPGYDATRFWDPTAPDDWGPWLSEPEITVVVPLVEDSIAESAAITAFSVGGSLMPVSSGANWGPNTSQAGHVETQRNGTSGKQVFTQYSNSTSYQRFYTGGSWSGWLPLITTREWQAVFTEPDLSVLTTPFTGIGKYKLPNSGTPTITEVTISLNTLPTGQSVIVDVNSINNTSNARTSLYTTQGNRPSITTSGPYSNVATLPDIIQPGAGAEVSVDVDQKGSGTAGAGLVVIIRGIY